jgi:pimeloyl-ACP methyl ester carboxylesterase
MRVLILATLVLLCLLFLLVIVHSVVVAFGRPGAWPLWWPSPRAPFLALTMITLIALSVIGKLDVWPSEPTIPLVEGVPEPGEHDGRLFVLVHGIEHGIGRGPDESWTSIKPALRPYGDVLTLQYPAGPLSNSDPDLIAQGVSKVIQEHSKRYTSIVLIGHSVGALIARKALLYALGGTGLKEDTLLGAEWGKKVERVVLLAGTNRGWDISGKRPLDMRPERYVQFWVGSWFGRLTGAGKLALATEAGAPFVANLRLQWMKWCRSQQGGGVEVVQLLGDIDDVVSEADNKDLRVTTSGKFAWLKIRGTGHQDILNVGDGANRNELESYRRRKFLLAATKPFAEIEGSNEDQPLGTDPTITHVVFILHGIRDLGRWSANFEEDLRRQAPAEKLAVASIRYGYFGMGQFLLRGDRQKYVRWFMDEYTETLGKYPNAKRIDFVGHSNGTYLLASALERYQSLVVDRIVFAGSVVRKGYDWETIFSRGQVKGSVRNYVAADDWVVALFPAVFEQWPLYYLGDDVGSAGFNGFVQNRESRSSVRVENVKFIRGQHAAFLAREYVRAIAEFVTDSKGEVNAGSVGGRGEWVWLKIVSKYLCWAVWLGLVAIVGFVGLRATGAATQPAWPVFVAYIVLVVLLLGTF